MLTINLYHTTVPKFFTNGCIAQNRQSKQVNIFFLASCPLPWNIFSDQLSYTHLGERICPSSVGWNLSKSSQCRRTPLVLHAPQVNAVCFFTQTKAKLNSNRASESKEQLKSQSVGPWGRWMWWCKKGGSGFQTEPWLPPEAQTSGPSIHMWRRNMQKSPRDNIGPHFYPVYCISGSICIVCIQTFTFYEVESHYVFLVGLGLPITPEWPWAHRHPPASALVSCYFLWETDISIVLTLHQGNIPLQLSERVTEMHNPSKCRGAEHRPRGYIYNTSLAPKAQGSLCKRRRKDDKSQRNRKFSVS